LISSPAPVRLVLVNPNTDPAVTATMLSIARNQLPGHVSLDGVTAPFGSRLIVNPEGLSTASRAVASLASSLAITACDGVVVSAFGDPGLAELRSVLGCPVTGLAEASMARAAENGRRFCVVTTTPDLSDAIAAAACRYGHGTNFVGTFCTPGDPAILMRDPVRLEDQLLQTCEMVLARQGVEAIVIGGGPLAVAARALAGRVPVPLVEPIREAMMLAIARCEDRSRQG
jgi:allantoin racemase